MSIRVFRFAARITEELVLMKTSGQGRDGISHKLRNPANEEGLAQTFHVTNLLCIFDAYWWWLEFEIVVFFNLNIYQRADEQFRFVSCGTFDTEL